VTAVTKNRRGNKRSVLAGSDGKQRLLRRRTSTDIASLGEPTWEIALLFPPQGEWTEEEYLGLHTKQLVEFSNGTVEVLPMPTDPHQSIVAALYLIVHAFVDRRQLGKVLFAPLRVRLWKGKIREPDIAFLLAKNKHLIKKYWHGADLVMEVVSEDEPDRDLKTKRAEYARAGISEYWIVDPRDETITVLRLRKARKTYSVAGKYRRGERATSVLLTGMNVEVSSIFSPE
jgi:Uma2 family endonuclease